MDDKIDFKRVILATVAAAGILATVIVAPSALQLFGPFLKKRKYNLESYLNQKAKKLVRDGLLKIEVEDGRQFVSLTKKGERALLYYQIAERKRPKWDGKWRVVIFDVWENTRRKRDILRLEIKNFGFIQLQRSVWIYPYECGDFIELLKANLSFGKNIRYMVVEKLDYDEKLRRYFELY